MRTARALPYAWFAALALAVSGPLLGGGRLLLLDYTSGPALFDPEPLPLPSAGRPANEAPAVAVLDLLEHIHPLLPDKALLLAPILLAGAGVYRFGALRLRLGTPASVYAGTLYAVNPFVLDRYLAGHLLLLVGYGLLPWAVTTADRALRDGSAGHGLGVGAWIAGLGAVSLHAAGIYVLVVAALGLVADGPARRRASILGTAVAVGATLSAYWLVPGLVDSGSSKPLAGELEAYASRPHGWRVFGSLVSLHGFWRDEFALPAERHSWLVLLLVPIIGLAALGLLTAGRRSTAIGLGVAGVLGVLLAASTAFPGARDLYEQLPGAAVYREPQKLLAATALAYALLGAVALARIRRGPVLAAVAIAVALAYGHGLVWGLGGRVDLARYPPGWAEAAGRMDAAGRGRALVLPWRPYAVWSFSGGRIVANPARAYFARDLLVASDAGLPGVGPRTRDPISQLIGRRPVGMLRPALLADAGVRFVLVLKGAQRQFDLQPLRRAHRRLYEDESILLVENRAWRPAPRGVAAIVKSPPLVEATRAGPGVTRHLPGWRRPEPTGAPWLLTDDRCTDGWRLGDATAVCHLGAVAAFPRQTRREPLWRPAAGLAVLGYSLSVAAALALVALVLKARLERGKAPHTANSA